MQIGMKQKKEHSPKPLLWDHKREGKKFIPPLMQLDINLTDWRREKIPELLWIALIAKQFGIERALDLTLEFSEIVSDITKEKSAEWCFVTKYGTMSEESKLSLLSALQSDRRLSDLRLALGPLYHYENCPMRFLLLNEEPSKDKHVVILMETVNAMYDRTTEFSTEVLSLAYRICLASGKFFFMEGLELPDLNSVADYPNTDESRAAASFIRAEFGAFFGLTYEGQTEWGKNFWNANIKLSNCI